jgi:hypothetical protein
VSQLESICAKKVWRRQYAKAGLTFKHQLLDQAMALLGDHRKSAIRALRARPAPPRAVAVILGRPREYDPARLLPVLKPIWFAAFQPCGARTLDRLIAPLRVTLRRRGGTRPGSLLRQSIPIAESGRRRARAGWRWTPWLCAAARWMTRTPGCSMAWIY